MKKRLIVCIIMAAAILMCVQKPFSRAENPVFSYQCPDGAQSVNLTKNDYIDWAEVPGSYLYYENNQYVRVELIEGKVVIERYSSDFKLLSSQTKEMQLPKYGGAYHGESYNFLVFGQDNLEEKPDMEVLRVVKYSHDWQEIDHFSTYGDNTYKPFRAGSCDIFEMNGLLYIRTCHEMFKTEQDPRNHQANLRYVINEETMEVVEKATKFGNGYVSHSFNQLQCNDNDFYYTADHGDAYPRGILLTTVNYGTIISSSTEQVYEIYGDTGENYTGMSIGGFEKAGNNLLTAINTSNSDIYTEWYQDNPRNIRLLVTTAPDLSSTNIVRYTDYHADSEIVVRTPMLVKISESRLLLMWEEKTSEGYWTRMVMVNDNGQPVTDVIRCGAPLSDCQPIVVDKNVIWYTSNGLNVTLYKIDCSSDSSLEKYSEQKIVTLETMKNVLSDYTFMFDNDRESNAIILTEYIGKTGVTDLNELKKDYDISLKIAAYTYRDNRILKDVVFSPDITYVPYNAFEQCNNLEHIDLGQIRHISSSAFYGCSSLTEITIPQTVESMDSAVFEGCSKLKKINFESEKIKLYSGRYMFRGCISLEEIDISAFDTSETTDMGYMFSGCTALKSLDLSPLDTSNATNIEYMFYRCYRLFELDLTGFDTGNVTNMAGMFRECNTLMKVYVDDSFTTANVTNSERMFENAYMITGSNGTTYDSSYIDKEYAVIDKPGTPGYFS
ncbi:MAG: leucine-rich repeat protein, partial [Erysipelotrichaceae bacterium]|nr:leucine-rich repeat protein [Erysipelotrichaceae bacterium]